MSSTTPDRILRALLLRAAGWTQRAIADELGVSPTRVQQYLSRGRTEEEIEALRARVQARAAELREAGI
ncbi:helix-turn-helix domain-containing protein, partial [Leucobacter sp. BZR 635]